MKLTEEEKELLADLGNIALRFASIANVAQAESGEFDLKNVAYQPDVNDAVFHVHALQHMVLANAAARCYPDQYRLFGVRLPLGTYRKKREKK